ncbi:hypothetical protein ACXZ7E_15950 [Paenibacillus lautus]
MKKKTREIIVNGKKYLYVINQKYYQEKSEIILKITLENTKNITCTFRFVTWEDAITGSPLLMGISLKKRDVEEIEIFNLYHPRQIMKFINNAIDNGWNGESVVEFDGLDIMSQLGFEVLWLKPRK